MVFGFLITAKKIQVQKKISSSRGVEKDLARARAAIRDAVRARNYTSDKEETFVPRGSIYRNAYAFHQLSLSPFPSFVCFTQP